MKVLLFAVLLMAPVFAEAGNAYSALRGRFTGPMTVATSSEVGGTVTVTIAAPKKSRRMALIQLDATLTAEGAGNAVPVKGRLTLRNGRASAGDFLLGIGAMRRPVFLARLGGRTTTYRFTLRSSQGEGSMRWTLRLRDDELTITGDGDYRPRESAPQPIHVRILAKKR